MSVRLSGYMVTEDVLLCQVFIDISQDPIISRNQSRDAFWSRVEDIYNELRDQHFELVRAKMLFMQEPKYKKGFKFDLVWNMVKNFEKIKDDVPTARQVGRRQPQSVNFDSSQSDNPTPDSPISTSPELSSFTPPE
ncbi:uncharacterized protein LOC109842095 [Asparagus officinalis]|uniref:uncharacterized protein LOC109842095 n=1 Tax=Asparagus officinalis TaxID=4686 RepID=UPI00098E4259|nr:uncharacterized protein LOC109842095 [Asparagus officinalis]